MKRPKMEPCSWCGGFGLVYGYMGEPTDCYHCGYSGVQEARDERGRFLPWEEVPDELPELAEPR